MGNRYRISCLVEDSVALYCLQKGTVDVVIDLIALKALLKSFPFISVSSYEAILDNLNKFNVIVIDEDLGKVFREEAKEKQPLISCSIDDLQTRETDLMTEIDSFIQQQFKAIMDARKNE